MLDSENCDDPDMDKKIEEFMAPLLSSRKSATAQRPAEGVGKPPNKSSSSIDSQVDSYTGLWKYLSQTVHKALSKLDTQQIDAVVPVHEQKSPDESSNLIEFEQSGLSQPNFLADLEVHDPLLVARKRFDQKYVHKSISKLVPKKERRSYELVNVDGVKKPWGQFKRQFEEEVKRRAEEGDLVKNAQFILNKDKANEKLLEWNFKSGFRSEDSDDEMAIFKRSERQYYRRLKKEHGEDAIVLKKRKLLPFEKLMLDCLGGRKIL